MRFALPLLAIVVIAGMGCSPDAPALPDAGSSPADGGGDVDAGRVDAGELPLPDAGPVDGGVDAGGSADDAGVDAGRIEADAGEEGDGGGDGDGGDGDGGDADGGDGDGGAPWGDADEDTISDLDEGRAAARDDDGDGTPDWLDDDSDDDCLADALEAGDDSLETPPLDSDADGAADVVDRDSDADRLRDGDEDADCDGVLDDGETARLLADSDEDGADDLVERTLATDPRDADDNPAGRGEIVFVLPFGAAALPESAIVAGVALAQKLDAYFLVDRSASLGIEIAALKENLDDALRSLSCSPLGTGAPGDCVAELWSGTGGIGYDVSGGEAFQNYLNLQPDADLTASSVVATTPSGTVETHHLALWSTVTGSGSEASGCTIADAYADRGTCAGSAAGEDGLGFPCFRPDAMRAVVMLTDEAPSASLDCPTRQVVTTAAVANEICIASLDASGSVAVRNDLVQLALNSGALDSGGAPLVFATDGPGMSATTTTLLRQIWARPLSATLRFEDDGSDDVDTAGLLSAIEVHDVNSALCTAGHSTSDSDSDGKDDTFLGVAAGAPVCWLLTAANNASLVEGAEAGVFSATARLQTPTGVLLGETRVHFLVRPAAPSSP